MPKTLQGRQIKASKTIPSQMVFEGEARILAAAKTEDGKPEGPAAFEMIANTGAPMDLEGFMDPVVIDMTGAKFARKRTPVLADHDTAKRIGYTTGQTVEATRISAQAVAASSMGIAKGFVEDARAGFPFQVSVGATIVEGYFVEKGDKAMVNGKTHKGPVIVAAKSLIRELSVVVLGADPGTSAKIAATIKPRPSREENSMKTFEEYVEALGLVASELSAAQTTTLKAAWKDSQASEETPTPSIQAGAKPSDEDALRRQKVAAEEGRLDSIRSISAQYGDLKEVEIDGKKFTPAQVKAQAISDNWSPDQMEVHFLRAQRNVGAPQAPSVHVAAQLRDADSKTVACAMIKASGKMPRSRKHQETGEDWGWEHSYDEKTLEASDHKHLKQISLHQVFDMMIQAAEGHSFSGNRRSQEFLQATRHAMQKIKAAGGTGMSTLEATQIFDDVANKLLLAGYQSVNSTWQEWAGVRSVNDFKTSNMYRLVDKGSYLPVGADGQLKHGGFADQKYTIAADTYGKMVGLTRKHLIDDDMDALGGRLTALGIEAAKFLEELAYVALLTQVGTTWTAPLGNLSTGAGSDLTIAGLSAIQQLFEDQVDEDNAPLMIEPDRILVGTQDRVQAGQLFNDTDVREGRSGTATTRQFTRNPHTSAFRPIVSGYLNNTAILQRVNSVGTAIPNQDTNQYFMFGNPSLPQGATIMMAFLNGNRTPFLEQADAAFDMLGLQWRAYHDAGTGVGDPNLSGRAAGV